MNAMQMELPLARNTDPQTSHAAAEKINVRAGTHRALLLAEYWKEPGGLTDEEAGERSGLKARGVGYWKRCSDLRNLELVANTGETRKGSQGTEQMVCKITLEGLKAMTEIER